MKHFLLRKQFMDWVDFIEIFDEDADLLFELKDDHSAYETRWKLQSPDSDEIATLTQAGPNSPYVIRSEGGLFAEICRELTCRFVNYRLSLPGEGECIFEVEVVQNTIGFEIKQQGVLIGSCTSAAWAPDGFYGLEILKEVNLIPLFCVLAAMRIDAEQGRMMRPPGKGSF